MASDTFHEEYQRFYERQFRASCGLLAEPSGKSTAGVPLNEVGGQDIFTEKPVFKCPDCDCACDAEFCDNGFGPYSTQVSPYHCGACG